MKRLLLLTAFSLLWIVPANAQTCLGTLPFDQARTRVRADALFTTDVHVFGVGISRGMNNDLFASGGLLLQSFSGEGGVNLGFFGSAGREYTTAAKKYFVCPVGTVAHVSFDGGSNTLVNVGGNVGFNVPTSGTTKIVPTVALSLSYERIGEPFGGAFSETFLNLQAGVGLIFNEKMSLQPQVVLPIGSDLVDPTFAVDFILKVGAQ